MVLYIDDGIVAGQGLKEAKRYSDLVCSALSKAGLVVNQYGYL